MPPVSSQPRRRRAARAARALRALGAAVLCVAVLLAPAAGGAAPDRGPGLGGAGLAAPGPSGIAEADPGSAPEPGSTPAPPLEEDPAAGCRGAAAILEGCADPYRVTDDLDPVAIGDYNVWKDFAADEECRVERRAGRNTVICSMNPGAGTTLAAFGDSHMYSLYPALRAIADRLGWHVEMRARSGCSGLGFASEGAPRDRIAYCETWSERVQAEIIADDGVDAVLYTAYAGLYDDAGIAHPERLFDDLLDAGRRLVVLRDIPVPPSRADDVPACIAESGRSSDPCALPREETESWLAEASTAATARLDLRDVLCDERRCHAVIGGEIVYRDSNHLAPGFSESLAPWLAERILPSCPLGITAACIGGLQAQYVPHAPYMPHAPYAPYAPSGGKPTFSGG